jgi:hypothetical protein
LKLVAVIRYAKMALSTRQVSFTNSFLLNFLELWSYQTVKQERKAKLGGWFEKKKDLEIEISGSDMVASFTNLSVD